MPPIRTKAVVLRATDVFESSKVVLLWTRELGKVSALAKGARRLKSPFQAALDLLSECDIVLLHKTTGALDLVTEAVLLDRFDPPRRDLSALYSGYYLAELLTELTHDLDPHPRLYDAALVTLRHLGDDRLRAHRLFRFELAILRELGLIPSLDACVHCGQAVEPASMRDLVSFGLAVGGVLCPDCRPGVPHVATLSGESLHALRLLASPGSTWRSLVLGPAQRAALRGTLGAVISHLIGHRPRLLAYLGA